MKMWRFIKNMPKVLIGVMGEMFYIFTPLFAAVTFIEVSYGGLIGFRAYFIFIGGLCATYYLIKKFGGKDE